MKKNIVILGAGPAGLTTGYELVHRDSDYSISIIERTPYVGGMCRTINANHFFFDIGGHRYFTTDKEIERWWMHFLPDEEFQVVQRSSHIIYQGAKFSYPISLSLQEMKILGYKTILKIALDYMKLKIKPKGIESLEDFYISRFGETLYHRFFETYTEKVCGEHPSMISPAWGNHRVGGLSISNILTNYRNKKELNSMDMRTTTNFFLYPKYGAGALWNNVSNEIVKAGGHIYFNDTVESVKFDGDTIKAVKCHSGQVLPVDYLVSSIPMRELISLIPNISPDIVGYGEALSYRDIVIVSFVFQFSCITGGLKESGELIHDQWLYIQDEGRKVSRIQLINNWSKDLIKESDYVGLCLEFYTSQNDEFDEFADLDWVSLALSELLNLGYIKDNSSPIEQVVFRQEKAYPCYSGAYKNISSIRQYIDSISNLVCIGRNGQHHYCNIDHVMETAFRAVNWIVDNCNKKTIWPMD